MCSTVYVSFFPPLHIYKDNTVNTLYEHGYKKKKKKNVKLNGANMHVSFINMHVGFKQVWISSASFGHALKMPQNSKYHRK